MTIAFIECFAGATCEMILGAWFDLGLDKRAWLEHMSKLGITAEVVKIDHETLHNIKATRVSISAEIMDNNLSLSDIEEYVDRMELPSPIKTKIKLVFRNLTHSVEKTSGATPDHILFNQLGDIDSVVSIIGNILAWHLLGEPQCVVSNIHLGAGVTRIGNESTLVPSPATMDLLLGFPIFPYPNFEETISITAAALIRTLAVPAPMKIFRAEAIGYGAGPYRLNPPNVLRIQLGEWSPQFVHEDKQENTVVIETNIDDMNPEWAGYLVERLLSKGAMDAYWIPIYMKKGRPALQLRVVCAQSRLSLIQEEIVRETTTIGMRIYKTGKWSVPREIIKINTSLGEFPIKIAYLKGEPINIAPEYENCRQAAEIHGIPVKQIYQQVLAEAVKLYGMQSEKQ